MSLKEGRAGAAAGLCRKHLDLHLHFQVLRDGLRKTLLLNPASASLRLQSTKERVVLSWYRPVHSQCQLVTFMKHNTN